MLRLGEFIIKVASLHLSYLTLLDFKNTL